MIRLANHIDKFLKFSLDNFDCYWLTTHCRDGSNKNVLKYLKPYCNEVTFEYLLNIKPTMWNTLKIEAIDLTSEFYWIDDAPIYTEIELLKNNNLLDNFIRIDTRKNNNDLKNAIKILEEKIKV